MNLQIEKTIVKEFETEANLTEEAWNIAERKYKSEEIVLESSEIQWRQRTIINPSKAAIK